MKKWMVVVLVVAVVAATVFYFAYLRVYEEKNTPLTVERVKNALLNDPEFISEVCSRCDEPVKRVNVITPKAAGTANLFSGDKVNQPAAVSRVEVVPPKPQGEVGKATTFSGDKQLELAVASTPAPKKDEAKVSKSQGVGVKATISGERKREPVVVQDEPSPNACFKSINRVAEGTANVFSGDPTGK